MFCIPILLHNLIDVWIWSPESIKAYFIYYHDCDLKWIMSEPNLFEFSS